MAEQSGPRIVMVRTGRTESGGLAVTVQDTGPGIAPAERNAVFQMGVRGAERSRPGSGIGLAIVKAITDRAGGDVRIDDSPLGGARFLVRLPLA